MRNSTVNVQAGLLALYNGFRQRERGGWREVGQLLDISGAYARQLAEGQRAITPKIARRYLALNLAPVKPARHGPPVHRPYITDPAKWAAYLEWSAGYDSGRAARKQEGEP